MFRFVHQVFVSSLERWKGFNKKELNKQGGDVEKMRAIIIIGLIFIIMMTLISVTGAAPENLQLNQPAYIKAASAAKINDTNFVIGVNPSEWTMS
jgi:hypothetical protein